MSRISKKTVFVGLSGGVDSSVSAYLLKKQGYNVIGAFIKSYNVDGCEEEDAEYARRVALKLGIPFYVFDMREEYFSRVVAEMIDGYRKGITPNPDILCNREIKFGLLWDRVKRLGADYLATGHYVRLQRKDEGRRMKDEGNQFHLLAAKDVNKDQSYFLWKLREEDLSHCLFPLGEYEKSEVRKIAKKAGLPTAEKKDSQGICFLGKVKLPEFLAQYISPKKGKILDTEGNVIGEHEGVQFYTIGQRHINVNYEFRSKNFKGDRKPYYVASKDAKTNTLVVAEGENHPALYKKEVELTDVSFINPKSYFHIQLNKQIVSIPEIDTNKGIEVLARVRYRQPLVPAKLSISGIDIGTLKGKLEFEKPVKFVAPGQSAVLYSKEGEMLGGGVIV